MLACPGDENSRIAVSLLVTLISFPWIVVSRAFVVLWLSPLVPASSMRIGSFCVVVRVTTVWLLLCSGRWTLTVTMRLCSMVCALKQWCSLAF